MAETANHRNHDHVTFKCLCSIDTEVETEINGLEMRIHWYFQGDAFGPLLFVLDEAPLQHKILNFGLFQAKTYANGL